MKNEIGPCQGNCPVQSEGFINDHPYYFRARGSHWTFDVALPGEDPVEAGTQYHRAAYVGPWPAAGWISVKDAEKIVADCVAEFREGKRGVFRCECPDCIEWRGMTVDQRIEKQMKEYEERSQQGIDALKQMRKDAAEEN